jgi:CRISPR-associated protein Cas5d
MTYDFALEIAGPMAMFMRPDSGSTPVSYPIPTGSAIKAMVESIAWTEGAFFRPRLIEVCAPICYGSYACNYGGPLRKPSQIKANTNFQHFARVLIHPCFKIYGECLQTGQRTPGNAPHKLSDMLDRRLRNGQSRFAPCLGWKEFLPNYFGPLRASTSRLETVSETVEGYLLDLWSKPISGQWSPRFRTVEIVGGKCVLHEEIYRAS